MGIEWIDNRFEDLLSAPVRNGIYKKKEFHGRGVKIVNMGELFGNPRLFDIEMKRVELTENEKSKFLIKKGDLLFARRSLTAEGAGKCTIVKEVIEDTTFESSIIRARASPQKADPDFLYYFFLSPFGRYLVGTILRQVAVSGITGSDLKNLKIPTPTLNEQKAFAHILGSLDDKIELNRRMNATLEGMAQALFKSWFVDFDPVIDKALAAGNPIPAELTERAETRRKVLADGAVNRDVGKQFPATFQFTDEMGWIPEGWEVKQVKKFGKVVCGKTPSKKNTGYYGNDVPFIKIPDMHNNVWITETTDNLSFEGAKSQHKKEIPPYSICVSCIATVGKVIITSSQSHTNQQINSVIPKHRSLIYYLYFSFSGMGKELEDLASGGSATLNLNTGNFSKIEIISPPTELLNEYHETIKNLFCKILNNEHQSKSLITLRDTLLPKLLSGQLRIPDAEKLMEETL